MAGIVHFHAAENLNFTYVSSSVSIRQYVCIIALSRIKDESLPRPVAYSMGHTV